MQRLFGPKGRKMAAALLVLVLIVMLFPFYVIGRSAMEYEGADGVSRFSFRNWRVLFAHLPVGRQLFNSSVVTLGSVAVILLVSALAAFALSKLRPRFGGALLSAVTASMMIPMQSIILTEFINFASLGLTDNMLSVILTYAALGVPFGSFLLTAFMRDLPDELIEAAQIDGMAYWR
ncbi:MAG TPA: ABC transporter permease subunit, partial [Acetobacteraceae bacterium]|nr:ABC transporter permease subunit [Acetobacteraceae bacterium]